MMATRTQADGDPDLRFHRILGRTVELLDAQMLLDPLEEQFDLPARFVDCAVGGCRQDEVVGQEHQRLAGLGVLESNAPQMHRVVPAGK